MCYKSMIILSLIILVGTACSPNTSPTLENSNTPSSQHVTPTAIIPIDEESNDLGKNQLGSISLTVSELIQPLTTDEIHVFYVLLNHNVENADEVQVTLNTIKGSAWRVALCYGELCVVHDGEDEIEQALQVRAGETAAIEIKVFVPRSAQTGDEKTIEIKSMIHNDPTISSSLNLTGYVP